MDHPALLANENVPAPLLRLLRSAGVAVAAVGESMPGASDRKVLEHAHEHGLWLLTFDRDYGELVFARRAASPPAILYLRQGPQPMADYAEAVLELLDRAATLQGHLVVVSGRGVRLRPLPIET
jgi:predicted nuclease of predicted toxin-antitoxin system